METRLILIRHGHTAGNSVGPAVRMSGWTDLPLSERGRREVEALGRALASGAPFAAIVSSPLVRAWETARVLSSAGLGELQRVDELREIHCGEVDGLPFEEVQERYPQLWAANLRQTDPDFRWPGGESYREFRERSLRGVRSIAARHEGRRVAVVTHAGVISQIVGFLHGVNPAEWERFRPENASLTEIDWSGDRGTLLCFGVRA